MVRQAFAQDEPAVLSPLASADYQREVLQAVFDRHRTGIQAPGADDGEFYETLRGARQICEMNSSGKPGSGAGGC